MVARGWEGIGLDVRSGYGDDRRHGLRSTVKVFRHVAYVVVVLVVGGIALFAVGDFLWHQVVTAPHPAPCQTAANPARTC